MPVSLHEILELSDRKPHLNRYLKFFSHDGKRYAYLNRMPSRISFMEISEEMEKLLKQFNGNISIKETAAAESLDVSFFEVIKSFYKNSILMEKDKTFIYPKPKVLGLVIYPTTICNLRCIYCYASAGDNTPIVIDIKKVESWMNYLLANRDDNVKFVKLMFHGGGEPTSVFPQMKAIWEMVKKRCENENLIPLLSTISNGVFNDEILKWLIDQKVDIYFSIDGDEDSHDKLRPGANGKGSFNTAYNNLIKIREAGLKAGIRCTVTRHNINQLKNLVDLVKHHDLTYLHLGQFSRYGRSDNPAELEVSYEDYKNSYFEAWKYALDQGVKMNGYPVIALKAGRNFFCINYSQSSFSLTSEGYLSTCPEVSFSTDPVSDVFFTGKVEDDNSIVFYEDRIDKLKQRLQYDFTECKNCFLEYTCNTGCSVKSFRTNEDLLKLVKEECSLISDLSMSMLKHTLTHHSIIPKEQKSEFINFSPPDNEEFNLKYISFNPF
jgi:uncharacterized protein